MAGRSCSNLGGQTATQEATKGARKRKYPRAAGTVPEGGTESSANNPSKGKKHEVYGAMMVELRITNWYNENDVLYAKQGVS